MGLSIPYPNAALIHPFKTLVLTVFIAVIAATISIGIPGLVAYKSGLAFTNEALEKTLEGLRDKKSISKKVWEKLVDFKKERETREKAIKNIQNGDGTKFNELINLRNEERLVKSPIRLLPFVSNWTPWDSLDLTCLGLLILVARPPKKATDSLNRNLRWKIFFGACAIELLRAVPHYARNFWLNTTDAGRTVFAYPNWDIDPTSFITQELIQFPVGFLLAILWWQWWSYLKNVRQTLAIDERDAIRAALNPNRIEALSVDYIRWQIASLLIAVPFLMNTLFYWRMVGESADYRYFPSAVICHLLWVFTWILASLPLLERWYDWHRYRTKAFCELAFGMNNPIANDALKAIEPIPLWSLIGTSVASIVALALPLFNAFVKAV